MMSTIVERSRRHLVRLAAIAASSIFAACAHDRMPVAPAGASSIRLGVVSGNAQRGFVGTTLDTGITVLATGASGAPLGSVAVHFTGAAGAVSDSVVMTGANGEAAYLWTLGNAPGQQSLLVHIDGSAEATLTITAQAYLLSQADVVVVHNASPGSVTVLDVVNSSNFIPHPLTWPDTILRFVPRDANSPQQSVSAYELGHLPDNASGPWTPRTDTIHLNLGPVIPLPVTVWVFHDYASTVATADSDLAYVDSVWRSNPFGLAVGKVRFIDVTNIMLYPPFGCQNSLPGTDSTAVNLYYLPFGPDGTIGDESPGFNGYTCTASTILIAPHSAGGYPWLVAHEFGHAFDLHHVTDPAFLMYPCACFGSLVTIPQLDTVFFSPSSSINAVYRLYPTADVSQSHLTSNFNAVRGANVRRRP